MADEDVKQVTIAEARERAAVGKAAIIDIRMPFDYMGGRIPGSLNLPNNALRARQSEAPTDKELLFLSEDGSSSVEVCRLAMKLGFREVANIQGGYEAWVEAGFPIETITDGPGVLA